MTKRGRTAVTGALAVTAAAVGLWGTLVATGTPSGTSGAAQAISAPAGADALQRIPGKVVRVTDGDTVHVATAANPDLDVRIVGMNAPESVPPRPKGCGGKAASEHAKALMPVGTPVNLVVDPKVKSSVKGANPPVDRYGRPLAMIEIGSLNYSLDAVAQGYAVFNDYGSRLTLDQQFTEAQKTAQGRRVGIWGTTKGAATEPGAGAVCTPETSYPR